MNAFIFISIVVLVFSSVFKVCESMCRHFLRALLSKVYSVWKAYISKRKTKQEIKIEKYKNIINLFCVYIAFISISQHFSQTKSHFIYKLPIFFHLILWKIFLSIPSMSDLLTSGGGVTDCLWANTIQSILLLLKVSGLKKIIEMTCLLLFIHKTLTVWAFYLLFVCLL